MKRLLCLIFCALLSIEEVASEQAKAYIFAGYGSDPDKELYQRIGAAFHSRGIVPVYVKVDWSTGSIFDYVGQARRVLLTNGGGPIYFYGFSMGGLIALSLGGEFKPAGIVVSSVAPFFHEDIELLSWYEPKRMYNWYLFGDSHSISVKELISSLANRGVQLSILYGSKENKSLISRSKYIGNALGGEITEMLGVDHGLSEPGHLSYIQDVIKRLTFTQYD